MIIEISHRRLTRIGDARGGKGRLDSRSPFFARNPMAQDQIHDPRPAHRHRHDTPRLTPTQRGWLRAGLREPGGKLPLFDGLGQRVSDRTVRSCIRNGGPNPGSTIRSSRAGSCAS